LYEIITGEKAFDNDFVVFHFAVSKETKQMSTPDWLDQRSNEFLVLWIGEMLEVEPRNRPSAEQTGNKLGDFLLLLAATNGTQDPSMGSTLNLLTTENLLGTDVATGQRMLGWDDVLSREAGLHNQTIGRYERLKDSRHRLLGPQHPNTVWSMLCFAWGQFYAGPSEDVVNLFQDVVSIKSSILGPEHPKTLSALGGLAWAYLTYDDRSLKKQNCTLFQQTWETMQRVLGPEHPETLVCMEGWASALTALGSAKRLEVFQKLVAVQKDVLGINNPDTLLSMSGLAWVYYEQGMLQEASDLYQDVVEAQIKVLKRDHVDTLDSMCGQAWVYASLHEKEAALAIFEEVIELQTRVLGADHYTTLETREKTVKVRRELTRGGRKGRAGRFVGN
jgi:tetratricopeptide (TPR) repeat protein